MAKVSAKISEILSVTDQVLGSDGHNPTQKLHFGHFTFTVAVTIKASGKPMMMFFNDTHL